MAIDLANLMQERNYSHLMRACSTLVLVTLALGAPRVSFAEDKTEPSSESEYRNWRIAGIVSVTGGVALLASALAYRDRSQDNKETYNRLVQAGIPWQDGQGQAYNDWQSSLNKKRITASVGAMALISGSLIYYFTRPSDNADKSSIRITPTANLDSSHVRAGLELGLNF